MNAKGVALVLAGFLLGLGSATAYAVLGDDGPEEVPLAHLPAGVVDTLAPDSLAVDSVAVDTVAVDSMAVDSVGGLPVPAPADALLQPVLVDSAADSAATAPGAAPDTAARGRLARVFGKMKPEEAARVLEAMDDAEAQVLLHGLSERKAGQILGRMSPQRAAALSRAVLNNGRGEP